MCFHLVHGKMKLEISPPFCSISAHFFIPKFSFSQSQTHFFKDVNLLRVGHKYKTSVFLLKMFDTLIWCFLFFSCRCTFQVYSTHSWLVKSTACNGQICNYKHGVHQILCSNLDNFKGFFNITKGLVMQIRLKCLKVLIKNAFQNL